MVEINHLSPATNLQVEGRAGQVNSYNCVVEAFQEQTYKLSQRKLCDSDLVEGTRQESPVLA